MRRVITQIIEAQGDIEVIATARDGAETIELAQRLRPDVITLDIHMPRVDGLRAVEVIMGRHPVPIVIISSYAKRGGVAATQALTYGAVEIVEKPSRVGVSLDLELQADEIRAKVRAAARVRVVRTASFGMACRSRLPVPPRPSPAARAPLPVRTPHLPHNGLPIVAIGASTGGPAALGEMLPLIPSGFRGCLLIVQHMPPGYTNDLDQCLNRRTALTVVEAQHGDPLIPGVAYIAPGGCHMEFARDRVKVHTGPRVDMYRPSVELLFESLLDVPERVQAVMLSGMGDDGVRAMKRLRAKGAATVVQDEDSSVVWGMPGSAMRTGCATLQLPPARMAEYLCTAVGVENAPAASQTHIPHPARG
jgi:two-component system chemotaxis response regulator CheB